MPAGQPCPVDALVSSPARSRNFNQRRPHIILGLVRHNLVITLLSPAVIPDSDDLRTIAVTAGPNRVEYLTSSSFNRSPVARAFFDNPPLPNTT